jgi:hypothetical protein
MEVITIDSKAYRELMAKIDRIADYVLNHSQKSKEIVNKEIWLDSQEVANLLHISTKTLQRLRKDNMISYTMLSIRHKLD